MALMDYSCIYKLIFEKFSGWYEQLLARIGP